MCASTVPQRLLDPLLKVSSGQCARYPRYEPHSDNPGDDNGTESPAWDRHINVRAPHARIARFGATVGANVLLAQTVRQDRQIHWSDHRYSARHWHFYAYLAPVADPVCVWRLHGLAQSDSLWPGWVSVSVRVRLEWGLQSVSRSSDLPVQSPARWVLR